MTARGYCHTELNTFTTGRFTTTALDVNRVLPRSCDLCTAAFCSAVDFSQSMLQEKWCWHPPLFLSPLFLSEIPDPWLHSGVEKLLIELPRWPVSQQSELIGGFVPLCYKYSFSIICYWAYCLTHWFIVEGCFIMLIDIVIWHRFLFYLSSFFFLKCLIS